MLRGERERRPGCPGLTGCFAPVGTSFPQRHAQVLLVAPPILNNRDLSLGVNENRGGNELGPIAPGNHSVRIQERSETVGIQKPANQIWRLRDVNSEDNQTPASKSPVQFFQMRHLHSARPAPSCPRIEQDHPPAQPADTERVSIEISEGEIRSEGVPCEVRCTSRIGRRLRDSPGCQSRAAPGPSLPTCLWRPESGPAPGTYTIPSLVSSIRPRPGGCNQVSLAPLISRPTVTSSPFLSSLTARLAVDIWQY
jgi:hypothetical protein